MIHTLNIPVQGIHTMVDVDNVNVEVPITTTRNKQEINTLCTIAKIPEDYQDSEIDKEFSPEAVEITHLVNRIVYIGRVKTNSDVADSDTKYYDLTVRFANEKEKTLVVPDYIKFYSWNSGFFIPVNLLRSRHLLKDYAWQNVRVVSVEEHPDYAVKEYYCIRINGVPNFYIDGILANVSEHEFAN